MDGLAGFSKCLRIIIRGFPAGVSGKEPACQCRRQKRHESNRWVGKIPWRRPWQPTPVFLPQNPMDRGAWKATVHRVTKSRAQLKQLGIYIYSFILSHCPVSPFSLRVSISHDRSDLAHMHVHMTKYKFKRGCEGTTLPIYAGPILSWKNLWF